MGLGINPELKAFYGRRLRSRDLAFDIGANEGRHTAAMLNCGARVLAIEPQASLARRLKRDYRTATVLAVGVSDQPGQATLITSTAMSHLATVNPAWPENYREEAARAGLLHVEWDSEEIIRLTTLDDLIAEFGCPAFIKIDTEGLEDKVLAGLSQPVEQILFEVHIALADVATRSFERLAALGVYEYRVMVEESWVFGPLMSATAILEDLPGWGDVYARRLKHVAT
jgi:FkbM family methyltransferase